MKWTPTRPGDQFYVQSAYLHVCFYHIRIFAHRPFIPTPTTQSSMSFSSLAMCTNAARRIAYVIESPSLSGLCALAPMPTAVVCTTSLTSEVAILMICFRRLSLWLELSSFCQRGRIVAPKQRPVLTMTWHMYMLVLTTSRILNIGE